MYIVSLEIAKKLKKSGWRFQDEYNSLWWADYGPKYDGTNIKIGDGWTNEHPNAWPAPILGELIRELPENCELIKTIAGVEGISQYRLVIYNSRNAEIICHEMAETPEDAAALAWIALKKKG